MTKLTLINTLSDRLAQTLQENCFANTVTLNGRQQLTLCFHEQRRRKRGEQRHGVKEILFFEPRRPNT